MVVFVDYDRDAYDDALQHLPGEQGAVLPSHLVPDKSSLLSKPVTPALDPVPVSAAAPSQGQDEPQTRHLECDSAAAPNDEQENPNVNSFSAALSCYPYALSTRTCRVAFSAGVVLTEVQDRQRDRQIRRPEHPSRPLHDVPSVPGESDAVSPAVDQADPAVRERVHRDAVRPAGR